MMQFKNSVLCNVLISPLSHKRLLYRCMLPPGEQSWALGQMMFGCKATFVSNVDTGPLRPVMKWGVSESQSWFMRLVSTSISFVKEDSQQCATTNSTMTHIPSHTQKRQLCFISTDIIISLLCHSYF